MARRSRKLSFGRATVWSRSVQRTLKALTRATLRAGTRAAKSARTKAVRPAVAKVAKLAKPAGAGGGWSTGLAIGAGGMRRYRLFKPPGARKAAHLPLLVMLHGCDQDAASFALGTRMHRLAAREGFFVLCPEQERLANAHGCWNWFDTRSQRAFAEAESILAAIDQVCARHGADPRRVAVAGLSAGASLAALLAWRHPERFKAVAMHSGIAPGAAHSSATALAAMQGRRPPHLRAAEATGTLELPPLLVIHGTADAIVREGNGRAAALAWAETCGAYPGAVRTVQRGARYPMAVTDFRRRARVIVSLCEVTGLGHAWSGGAASQAYTDPKGPDASRLIWAFAARQFRNAETGAPGARQSSPGPKR